MSKVVFHIGLRKTGSSALQETLSKCDSLLGHYGVNYPARLTHFPAHQELAWSLLEEFDNLPADWRSFDVVADQYRRQIEGNAVKSLDTIISSEDLSLISFSFNDLHRFYSAFKEYDPVIFLFERDPVSFHISNYKHAIVAGREKRNFMDFTLGVNKIAYAQLGHVASIWEQFFGMDRVLRASYDDDTRREKGILWFFLNKAMGIDIEVDSVERQSNRSIPDSAVEYVLSLNRSELPDADISRLKDEIQRNTFNSVKSEGVEAPPYLKNIEFLRSIYSP
ncbi:MAG: hypothetical protein AAF871_14950 [Pseudomonadota bacterium]